MSASPSSPPPSPPPAPPRSPSPPPSPSYLYLCVPCNATFPTLLAAVTHRRDSPSHSTSLPTSTSLAPVVLFSLVQHPDIVTTSVHSPAETRRLKEDDLARILIDQVTTALPSSSIRSAIKNLVTTPKRASEHAPPGRSKVVKLTAQDNRTRNTQNFFHPTPVAAVPADPVTVVVKLGFTPPVFRRIAVPSTVASGNELLTLIAAEHDLGEVWALARTRWAFDLRPLAGAAVTGRVVGDEDVVEVLRRREGVWYRKMELG